MKKIALSLFVFAASGAYVWDFSGRGTTNEFRVSPLPSGDIPASNQWRAPGKPEPAVVRGLAPIQGSALALSNSLGTKPIKEPPPDAPALGGTTSMPSTPLLLPPVPAFDVPAMPAAMTIVASPHLADGTYTGPVVDAYYGLIQIQANIKGGQLVGIRVLKYPSDRRTSISINRKALPMLRDEVISAQSANVDIVTGATLTSEAFIRSLGVALQKAGS